MNFTLNIKLGEHDAMQHVHDVAEALHAVASTLQAHGIETSADELDAYDRSQNIRDVNGNTVGNWMLSGDALDAPKAVEGIILTPVGCSTPEGARRVNDTMQLFNDSTAQVANLADRFVSLEPLVSNELSDELSELRAAVELRNERQEAFLRAVAGVPAR